MSFKRKQVINWNETWKFNNKFNIKESENGKCTTNLTDKYIEKSKINGIKN